MGNFAEILRELADLLDSDPERFGQEVRARLARVLSDLLAPALPPGGEWMEDPDHPGEWLLKVRGGGR